MDLLPSFALLGLSQDTLKALEKKGFEEPTEIQKACIPLLLEEGTEVVGQAQTGTGKTAAFALPIIETITEEKCVQALILAPTRELALQVAEEINSLKGDRKLEVAPIYGGASMSNQLKKLRKGVQIVVGTPGRILDHIHRGTLKLDSLSFMVLDEADEMLDMGFIEDIEAILQVAPEKKRMLMFSATMPAEILKLSQTFMKNAKIIRTQKEDMSSAATDQIYYEVRESDKIEALTRIIDRDPDFYGVVFCRTKLQCDEVAKKLSNRGYDTQALHGDLSQRERENIIQRLRDRQLNILIATDVAARGLDIKNLTHVINYSLPQDPEIYIHRVGRTGRAGRTGTAITFITPSEARKFSYIKRASKSEIRREEVPSINEVLECRKTRLMDELTKALDGSAKPEYLDIASALLKDKDSEETLALLLEHFYKDELDSSHYHDIEILKSRKEKKKQREKTNNDTKRPLDKIDRPSLDEEGYTRLFIARGRNDGLTKRDLVNIIIAQAGVDNKDIHDVTVMEEFSFINAPYSVAEKILNVFEKRNYGNSKPLVVRARAEERGKKRETKEDYRYKNKKGRRHSSDNTKKDKHKKRGRK